MGCIGLHLHQNLPIRDIQKQNHEFTNLCLVLLCDQNSFGRSKMVLVWPKWFGLDHNDLVTTKMKWSWPKWIGQVQIGIHFGIKSQFGPDQFILVVTISFVSWPNHYGQVQMNLVRPKPFWTNQNCCGHIEGQGSNLIWMSNRKVQSHTESSTDLV